MQRQPLQVLVRQETSRGDGVIGERQAFRHGGGERHLSLGEREDARRSVGGDGSRNRVGVEPGPVDDLTHAPQEPDERGQDRVLAVDHPDDPADATGRLGEHHRGDRHRVVHNDDPRELDVVVGIDLGLGRHVPSALVVC